MHTPQCARRRPACSVACCALWRFALPSLAVRLSNSQFDFIGQAEVGDKPSAGQKNKINMIIVCESAKLA